MSELKKVPVPVIFIPEAKSVAELREILVVVITKLAHNLANLQQRVDAAIPEEKKATSTTSATAASPVNQTIAGNLTVGQMVDAQGYKVSGTQVVGAQQADPGAPPSTVSITTSSVSGTADLTYDGTERDMLNNASAAIAWLNVDVALMGNALNAIIEDYDNLRTALQTHGLIA